MSSTLAKTDFLDHLKSIYPPDSADADGSNKCNPYYLIAAVGFSALNVPEALPSILTHALENAVNEDERKLITRRIRDALFKSGMTAGYSKVINSLLELKNATPENLLDTEIQRDTSVPLSSLSAQGREFFTQTYGPQSDSVQSLLDSIYPDMGYLSNTLAYGWVYPFSKYLTAAETSFVLVATLVAVDTPRQIKWHLDGARRNGASEAEVRAVRQMAVEVVAQVGVRERHEVPEI